MSFNFSSSNNANKSHNQYNYIQLKQHEDGSIEVPMDINLNPAEHMTERSKMSNGPQSFSKFVTNFFGFAAGSHEFAMRILSALLYALVSFLIVVVNKILLTNYKFPSFHFVGLGQMVTTLLVLSIAKWLNVISYPNISREVPRKIFPLPLLYLGNLVSGLGGTQRLSLPMFTVLRRFTILMTMAGEYYILGIVQSTAIKWTVVAMIGGAAMATLNDLAFDLLGYTMVLSNDFFTAANGICTKKKLDSRDLGKYGILYYNSLSMIVPLFMITWASGDFGKISNFEHSYDLGFISAFIGSCFMGFILMYSTVLCTAYNSALTTTIVGCLKNILVTYIGMVLGGDYVFSWNNFIGISLSMIGSLVYSYYVFIEKESKPLHPKAASLGT